MQERPKKTTESRFAFQAWKGDPPPPETSQEKMLRLLKVQHPVEEDKSIPLEQSVPILLKRLFENKK